jgi:4-hydroxy-2-oxoglutarate aldolase
MKAGMDAVTPGKQHELLARSVGTWSGKSTMWMYPGAQPVVSDTTATVTSILGGRFIKTQMTGEAFVRHYTAVADASPVPVLLYNFTALTGVNLLPATVHILAAHPNIAGMKESGGDIAQIADLVSGTPEDFSVLAGTAATFYAALCVGAAGGIVALAGVVPDACAQLFSYAREGRHAEALQIQRRLVPLARLLGPAHGVPGLKAALNLLGYDVGVPRPPLMRVADSVLPALREALAVFEEIAA